MRVSAFLDLHVKSQAHVEHTSNMILKKKKKIVWLSVTKIKFGSKPLFE